MPIPHTRAFNRTYELIDSGRTWCLQKYISLVVPPLQHTQSSRSWLCVDPIFLSKWVSTLSYPFCHTFRIIAINTHKSFKTVEALIDITVAETRFGAYAGKGYFIGRTADVNVLHIRLLKDKHTSHRFKLVTIMHRNIYYRISPSYGLVGWVSSSRHYSKCWQTNHQIKMPLLTLSCCGLNCSTFEHSFHQQFSDGTSLTVATNEHTLEPNL